MLYEVITGNEITMRPNRVSFRGVVGAAGLFIALALTGCAGARFKVPADPLVLLGDRAALYASIPVAPNRILLNKAAESLKGLEDKDRDSLSGLFDRTERVWVALSADRSVNAVLTGDFPRAAAPFVFPESKGWKRVKGPSGLAWYAKGSVSARITSYNVCYTKLLRLFKSIRFGATGIDA